jgi:hypothetical protein
MLRYIREHRYVFTPRVFASAFAGLPAMSYRQSISLCQKEPLTRGLEDSYRLLTFVQRVWDARTNSKLDHVMKLFEKRIPRLRRDRPLREKLQSNMGRLKRAVAEALQTYSYPSQAPYLITVLFEWLLAKPKTQKEIFLDSISTN